MFKKSYLSLPILILLFTNCKQQNNAKYTHGTFTFTECNIMDDHPPAKKMIQYHPEKFPFLDDIRIQHLDHLSNGASIEGFMVEPKKPGKYPIIIYNQGGNHKISTLNAGAALLYMAPIADAGYIVLATNYAGPNGVVKNEEFGGADVQHVINLIQDAKSLPNADSTKIGLIGISRGGMMNYLIQKEVGDAIKIDASVNISAISDLEMTIKHHPGIEDVCEDLIPNYKEHRATSLEQRSAIFWADQLSDHTAQLILCGTQDKHVHYQQAIDMAKALEKENKPHKIVVFEGDNHGLTKHTKEVHQLIASWLKTHL